jgi:CheY-like chemotaxis protein
MNLVLNARDAMRLGGRLTVETANITLDSSVIDGVAIAAGTYGMLAVSDTGIGMDEATRQRLFEPFFTTKDAGKGSGLGLSTAHGIVTQSGGHISVRSEIGKGASFKVYFPCADGSEWIEQVPATENAVAGTETVLVVEDQDAVRTLTSTILERAGYRVFKAANPQEAVELYETHMHLVSILVTDVIMPGSSGPKLFERLVRQCPDLKVLYLSGYTDETIVHQGELDADVDFLQKPFTADALNHRVRNILGEVPPERSPESR